MAEDNALLEIIKAARINGKNYTDIERMYGIAAPKAEAIMKAHYAALKIDPNEYRMLQMERLESLIDVLMSMAQMGNIKSAEVLIKLMEQINVLLGLNLEQTKIEIKIVTEQQMSVIFSILSGVSRDLLTVVQETVTNQKQLGKIEDIWDARIDSSYTVHSEEVIMGELVE